MSVKICIVAHAPLASALKTSVEHIFSRTGEAACEDVSALDIPEDADVPEWTARLADELDRAGPGGLLILTDIVGATPSNIAHAVLGRGPARVVAGVNLPCLVAAVSNTGKSLAEAAALAEGAARSGVSQRSEPITRTNDRD